LVLVAGVATASGRFSSGPLASMTGAPAIGGVPKEPDCTLCHLTFDDQGGRVPNLNLPGGGIEIDLPETYLDNQTYPITVRVSSDSTADDVARKWGFQLTAYFATSGLGAGTFDLPDPDELQILPGDPGVWQSRQYVEHTSLGTRTGVASPVSWTFNWQAPNGGGTVIFAASANAADGTFDPAQDFIYTTTDSVSDFPTPARTATWGGLKQRWR
jgi:hypothetical protein